VAPFILKRKSQGLKIFWNPNEPHVFIKKKGRILSLNYKVVNYKGKTRNGTDWLPFPVFHERDGLGEMWTSSWIYTFKTPLIASFMWPHYLNFVNPRLLEVEVSGKNIHNECEWAWQRVKSVGEIEFPLISPKQRIVTALACSLSIIKDKKYQSGVKNWLLNNDEIKFLKKGEIVKFLPNGEVIIVGLEEQIKHEILQCIKKLKNPKSTSSIARTLSGDVFLAQFRKNSKFPLQRILEWAISSEKTWNIEDLNFKT